jgi:tripartite ATP-independent transporter DctP family solute receptor
MNGLRRSFIVAALALAMAGGAQAQSKAKYTARIGHLEAATQPRHQGLIKVADRVRASTNGEVEFQLFPSSQLGNARQMIEGTQLGTEEGTVMPAAFVGGFNPAISILDIPYVFPSDRAAAQKLRAGPFGKALLDSFSSRGFVAIALWPNGRKSLTSNKSLDSLEAMKGQKFRVMDSKILIEQFAAVNASAVAINFGELYTALQTGVVDGEENPLDTISTMKFHEVQKYLVVTEHGAMEDVVLFNPGWWQKLPAAHRAAIVKAFDDERPEFEKNKDAAQQAALETIRASGKINVRIADEKERARLRDAMYPRARAAYLERAGAEGQKLIALYEQERKKLP